MDYKINKKYRLPEWDYTETGYYFITICIDKRKNYFGEIENGHIRLSPIGEIAVQFWIEIPKHFDNVVLDEWIIMPNHVHGIIEIKEKDLVGTGHRPVLSGNKFNARTGRCPVPTSNKSRFGNVPAKSVSVIIGSYKSICTKIINQKYPNLHFAWQTRFYDRVLRDEIELNNARIYIQYNPDKWQWSQDNLEGLYI